MSGYIYRERADLTCRLTASFSCRNRRVALCALQDKSYFYFTYIPCSPHMLLFVDKPIMGFAIVWAGTKRCGAPNNFVMVCGAVRHFCGTS
jgi:hypothetical protein